MLSTLLSLSTSSNEFLRQFWSAVLPPKLGDLSAAALVTSEMKAAKAERMKVCLDKAMGRIEGVLDDVRGMGDEGLLARVIGVSFSSFGLCVVNVGVARLICSLFRTYYRLYNP